MLTATPCNTLHVLLTACIYILQHSIFAAFTDTNISTYVFYRDTIKGMIHSAVYCHPPFHGVWPLSPIGCGLPLPWGVAFSLAHAVP